MADHIAPCNCDQALELTAAIENLVHVLAEGEFEKSDDPHAPKLRAAARRARKVCKKWALTCDSCKWVNTENCDYPYVEGPMPPGTPACDDYESEG